MKRPSLAPLLFTLGAITAAACTAAPPAGPVAPPASAAPSVAPPPPDAPPVSAAPAPSAAPAMATSAAPIPATSASAAAAPVALGPEGKGEASFYNTDGKGACSLNPPMNKHILSASKDIYQNADSCGTCLEIKGSAGTAIVQVMDICFTCPPGHVVISKPGFEATVGKDGGTGPISYKPVACPVGGKISIRVKEGATRDWTAVQIRDSAYAIRGVKLQKDGDTEWKTLTRSGDNYWSAPKAGAGDGGFKLQITAANGATIEETVAGKWKGGTVYPGANQF